MKRLLLLLLLLPAALRGAALEARVESLSNKDGLSQNTVRTIFQDSKGFVWMGTMNGLNRYDGKEFMVLRPQAGADQPTLPDGRIRAVMEDPGGLLWVKTYSNMVACYNPSLEKFVDCHDPQIEFNKCENFTIASTGEVWLWGKQVDLCRVRYADGKLSGTSYAGRLNGTIVKCVAEDADKTIWIGTDRGIMRIEGQKLITCNIDGHPYNIQDIRDEGHRICFYTDKRVIVFDRKDKTYLYMHAIPGDARINGAEPIAQGKLLVTTTHGIYIADSHRVQLSPAEGMFPGGAPQNAFPMVDNRGGVWLYNHTGNIWQHIPPAGNFSHMRLIEPQQMALIDFERFSIYHDSRNIIWITTYGNGLFALDQNTGRNTHFTADYAGGHGFSTDFLLCVTEDRSGEIWVGCEYAGAGKVSLSNYDTRVIFPEARTAKTSNSIRMVWEDPATQEIWMGSRSGYLYIYDKAMTPLHALSIPGGMPYCITEDAAGAKWIGTKGGGLLVFPPGEKKNYTAHTSHPDDSESLANNIIYSILCDSKGRMWVGTFGGGLHLAENKAGKITFRKFLNAVYNQSVIRAMVQDDDGMIWAGTNEGVIAFDPDRLIADREDFTAFTFDSRNKNTLSSNEIKSIYKDRQGRIWFGTSGGGVNLLTQREPLRESTFRHFTSQDGLSNDVVQAIAGDDQGMLWITTESGISRLNPETGGIEVFNFSNIRQGNLFCETAICKRQGGELLLGSFYGLYMIDPSEFMSNSYAPPVMITNLRINGNTVLPGDKGSPLRESITTTRHIRLRHDQSSFNIEFATLNFHESSMNRYTYILENYERTWNPITKHNVATYRNIPPGRYTFRVRGSNSFGVWNEQQTTLDFIVLPPWWRTAWAVAAYVLLAAAAIYFTWRLMTKMHKLNTEVEVEKQLSEYKIRFFTNISHEFRTPLTIMRGTIDSLITNRELSPNVGRQVQLLDKSSGRLMRLIDQLLEFRRVQNDKVELAPERTEIIEFFGDIHRMFAELAEKKKINFVFSANRPSYAMLLDRSKMDKIAYNLLSNAFKHTPAGGQIAMQILMDETADTLTLSVSDNGPGIPEEKRELLFTRFYQVSYSSAGTGVGLHLTAELVAAHKGSIRFAESAMGGACFTVAIPLKDRNYAEGESAHVFNPEAEAAYQPKLLQTIEQEELLSDEQLRKHKLLVIEDDDEVREFLYEQLGARFRVECAADGTEGFQMARKWQPDLVVSDVMMPGIDGFEVTRKLKADFETSHIPIIILTANASPEYLMEGTRAGADAYVTKPFNMEFLMASIIRLVNQRERLRRRFSIQPGTVQPAISSTDKDREFIDKLHRIIEENLTNSGFSVDEFAQMAGLGRTVFFKKVKLLTGYSPNEYLQILRMKKAAELLATTDLNVSEISYRVGIDDPLYFSKCFKAQFGKAPSHFKS